MRPKPSNASKATTLLFLWFGFINTQCLVLILCLVKWRLLFPRVPLTQATVWDSARMTKPGGLVVIGAAVLFIATGLLFPGLYYRLKRPSSIEVAPFFLRYAFFQLPAILGVVFGFTRDNPLLAVPFLGAVIGAACLSMPTNGRLKKLVISQP